MGGHSGAFHDQDRRTERNEPDAEDGFHFAKKVENHLEKLFPVQLALVQRSGTLVLEHAIMLPFEAVGYRTEFGREKCVQNSRKENHSSSEIEGVCLNSPHELLRDSGHISIGILCEGRWEACCCFRCLHRLQAGAEKGEEDQAE